MHKLLIPYLIILNFSCGNADNETDGENPTSSSSTTIVETPEYLKCDIWEQDCLNSKKCTVSSTDKDEFWNENTCQEFGDRQKDETCTIYEYYSSGIDNCDKGLVCMASGIEIFKGTCKHICTGTKNNPTCPDKEEKCVFLYGGVLPLCA